MTVLISETSATRRETVPGTVFLDNRDHVTDDSRLKKVPGTNIILAPQPSDSAADPLNWSKNKKTLYFVGLLITSIGGGIIGPLLVPSFSELSTLFNKPLSTIAQLNGGLVMALGVSSYFCNQLSTIYGKRALFLLTSLLQVAVSIWAACSNSFQSLLAARVFQGLLMGMNYSAAGSASISDVFFVHERSRMIGIWSFIILTTNNVTPIISGYVIEDLGWKWSFGIYAIYVFFSLVIHFFIVPESTYHRRKISTEESEVSDLAASSEDEKMKSSVKVVDCESQASEKTGFLGSLKIYHGRQTEQSTMYVLVRPFLMIQNPAIVWGILQWCLCYTWVIMIGSIASQMFSAAPYTFSVSQIGIISGVAPLVGTTIGTLFSGTASDYLIDYMARKNDGTYEPEFRLLMMIPYVILILIGGFGTGWTTDNGDKWIVVAVFMAILFCGVSFGVTAIISYTVDYLGDASGEAFGLMMLMKSAFAFGLIWEFNNWYAQSGPKNIFGVMAGVTAGVALLTIPLYVYGKRTRLYIKHRGLYKYD